MTIVAFLLAFALGALFVRCALPEFETRPRWAGWLLELSLAAGFGMGLTGSLYFVLLWAGLARYELWFELVALAILAVIVYRLRLRRPAVEAPAGPTFSWNWLLLLMLGVCGLLYALSFYEAAANNPQGEWDAWAIWNLRAKFLAGGEATWRNAISPLLDKTHPEYPLLLSGFIARCWGIAGETTSTAPLAAAWIFPAAACGVLLGGLAILRSVSMGLVAALILLTTGSYTGQSMAQYADVPLSFYLVAALVLLGCAERFPERARFLAAAGVAAGMAAWTKNEGAAFFVLALVGCGLFLGWRTPQWLVAGAAPFLILFAVFKAGLAPRVDTVIARDGGSFVSKLVEPGRYWQVFSAMVVDIWETGFPASHPLLVFLILVIFLRFRTRVELRSIRVVALPALGMMVAYFVALLTTRDDLRWQLDTTSSRLLMQIWPGLILAGLLTLKSIEEHATIAGPARKKARSK